MPPKIIIVGAGFGGLNAALILAKCDGIELTVIDKKNHHLFQPLLYQVATATISPADIATPIRSLIHKSGQGHQVVMSKVHHIDIEKKNVHAGHEIFHYDYLILACGSCHSYFGHPGWQNFAPGLKTIEQATEIRRRILSAFERADREHDQEEQKHWLSFVIVGAGPTGVELAGALAEISRLGLSSDFPKIDPKQVRILLVEAGPRILMQFSAELASRARRDLESLGVEVRTSTSVIDITREGVHVANGFIDAHTVLWAAGVAPSELNTKLGLHVDPTGRIRVNEYLQAQDHSEIFVIGDQAYSINNKGQPLPGLAPVAIQQGRYVGKSILSLIKNKEIKAFAYRNRGQLATIGRRKAIVEGPYLRWSGSLAWLIWLGVHIYFLIGFRNRLLVMIQWFSSYVVGHPGARLIVGRKWQQNNEIYTHRSRMPRRSKYMKSYGRLRFF